MILRKLKRLLGLESSSSADRGAGRDVTVRDDGTDGEADDDRDRTTRTTQTTQTTRTTQTTTDSPANTGAGAAEPEGDVDDAVATGTDADASTESLVDEEATSDSPTTAAEPAEAAGPDTEDVTTDIEEAEPDAAESATASDADGTPVDDVKGIGPAYSDRLGEIGIESAEELADADPSDVAERISVPEKTVRKWIDRAGGR